MIPSDGQIRWKCRRGMLEIDVPLTRFIDAHLASLSDEERVVLFEMLLEEDTTWWEWLVENKQPEGSDQVAMLNRIKNTK